MDRKRKRGFSLVEILVIGAVITAGLLPIINLFSQTARQVSFNEHMVIANLWAVQFIERHRMVPFEELKTRFSTPVDALTLLDSDPVLNDWWNTPPMTDKSRSFLKQFEVSLVFEPDSRYPNFYGQLVCRVSWQSKQGPIRSEERVLLVEKRP